MTGIAGCCARAASGHAAAAPPRAAMNSRRLTDSPQSQPGLAEFEGELIRSRTDDGRKRAKARGVRFGRPKSLTPHQRQEVLQRVKDGAVQADLARTYGVSQATISRLVAPSPFEASPVAGIG
jgi:DNA-binding NarL/FixJ family response regulator